MTRASNRMASRILLPFIALSIGLWIGCQPTPAVDDSKSADQDYGDRMSEEHGGETPEASPMTEGAPAADAELETSEVEYATVRGASVAGYLALPKTGGEGEGDEGEKAGLIVIQEWWGLNDNIRAMSRHFAGEGYVALAVDLYGGEVATDAQGARALMQAAMEGKDATKSNLAQAISYLRDELGVTKVGVVGWCFGGGWTLQTAINQPGEVDAAVMYYGRVENDRERIAALGPPLLGLFGASDQGIPVDEVRAFKASAEELGKDVEIHIYEGANHAFANPSGRSYQQDAAEKAWNRTLSFFGTHLKGEAPSDS